MSPLVKIRAERDQMSAIERRIADFILENAQLLRDYSSQQLADALGISQSSVVKFSQKLGFKGYPDLKYSIGEAMRAPDNGRRRRVPAATEAPELMSGDLWRRKSRSRSRNAPDQPARRRWSASPQRSAAPARCSSSASGEDGIHARAFALAPVAARHPRPCTTSTPRTWARASSAAAPGDVLLVFSEHGKQPALCQLAPQHARAAAARWSRSPGTPPTRCARMPTSRCWCRRTTSGRTSSRCCTRRRCSTCWIALFVLLCEGRGDRLATLQANQERIRLLPEG